MSLSSRNKNPRTRPGVLVAIPLPSGGYGFGRILDKLMAFYAIKSDCILEMSEITRHPVIFITAVRAQALKLKRWQVIGYAPLEPEFKKDVKFFRPNLSPGKPFLIYVSKAEPHNAYEDYEANPEECVGMEPMGVWEATGIEERLDEFFSGKANAFVERCLDNLRRHL